jgi:hypothetical protein
VQLGLNVFRDVLLTAQLLEVLRYSIETWNEFAQRNTQAYEPSHFFIS